MALASPLARISIVVKWLHDAALQSAADRVILRLRKHCLATTWAIEHPQQARALQAAASPNPVELAVLARQFPQGDIRVASPAAEWLAEIARRAAAIAGAGVPASTICVDGPYARRPIERQLHALGIGAVVTASAPRGGSPVRPLPYGLVHFAVEHAFPRRRHWTRIFGRNRRGLFELEQPAGQTLQIASIDLSAVAALGPVGMEGVEALLDRTAEACASGAWASTRIADAAVSFLHQHVGRPQRSILRAA